MYVSRRVFRGSEGRKVRAEQRLEAAMTEYEAVIEAAEREASGGRYKDAYNTLGKALALGGPADLECRYRRGAYALRVAHSRLDGLPESRAPKETLIKAGCWLARSEAYLLSAAEGVAEPDAHWIERDLQQAKEQQDRFRELCRQLDTGLFAKAIDNSQN